MLVIAASRHCAWYSRAFSEGDGMLGFPPFWEPDPDRGLRCHGLSPFATHANDHRRNPRLWD